MSLIKKELTEKSGFSLEFSVSAEAYAKAELEAYKKNVKSINIPGFRKGKAPLHIIKTYYGKDVFFEDAINACIPDAFEAAVKEAELTIVGTPKFDLVSNDGDIVLKAEGFVKPEVSIEGYRGLNVKKKAVKVTAKEVDEEIERVRDRNARFVTEYENAVAIGDTVSIDFEGFIDGEAFEGGKGQDHELKLGSGSFIPGFEDQVAGHKLGEDFDVNVTFPEDYHAEALKGKAATFKVSLKSLKQLPELDDEFVKDVSEFDTLDEYKKDVKAKISKRKDAEAETEFENALAEALMEKLVAEIPEPMFEAETENFLRDYDTQLRQSGLDLKTYMKYTGMTLDSIREQLRPRAEKQVKVRLALEKIAALEALSATEDEINQEYERIATAYNVKLDEVKAMIAAEDLSADIVVGKAMTLVKESVQKSQKSKEN
ncbi:MAG: trigger factor [Clostridia bacterium]|nr:trigger factor [Clostridia bacterium]